MFKKIPNTILALYSKLLASFLVCFMSVAMESLKESNLSAYEQFFFIVLFGSVILFPYHIYYIRKSNPAMLNGKQIAYYFARGGISIAAIVLWILAIQDFGATNAILVNYITPILVMLIASITGDEALSKKYIFAGATCYMLIFYAMSDYINISLSSKGFIFSFISSTLLAFYEIICKRQADQNPVPQAFYTFFCAAILMAPCMIWNLLDASTGALQRILNVDISTFAMLFIIAIIRIGNIIALFIAIKLAYLRQLITFAYFRYPITLFLDFIIKGEYPSKEGVIVGTCLIAVNFIILQAIKRASSSS